MVAQLILGTDRLGDLLRRIQPVIHRKAALAGIERRQLIRAVADDGHTARFEIFHGQREIQDALRAGADHDDRRLAKLFQVGGDVHRLLRAAVYAADAARRMDAHARHGSKDHRAGNGRRAVELFRNKQRDIPAARLDDLRPRAGKVIQLIRFKAHAELAAKDGAGGRHGAVFAGNALAALRSLKVLRVRHAVGNDGGFKRNDGFPLRKRFFHLTGNKQMLIHDTLTLLCIAIRFTS